MRNTCCVFHNIGAAFSSEAFLSHIDIYHIIYLLLVSGVSLNKITSIILHWKNFVVSLTE